MNNNFLDGIIIADLEEMLQNQYDSFHSSRQAQTIMQDVFKSLIVIVQGEDLNGKIGVADAEYFSWNPYGNDHFTTNTNDANTCTELVLRLEWFDCCDVAEGIETAVKFALKELGIHSLHNIAEGIAGTVFTAWQRTPDIHEDIKLRFDFVEL
jgi:hypothetical protein